jgi:hypothetical protein
MMNILTNRGGLIMKKWKIILAVISVMLLAGAGTLYYLLEVKSYETQDEKVDEVVAEEYDIALPGEEGSDDAAAEGSEDTAEAGDEEGSSEGTDQKSSDTSSTSTDSNSSSSSTSTSASNTGSTSSKTAANTTGKTAASNDKTVSNQGSGSKSKPTAAQIAAKYEPSFQQLEAQANGKIDALVGHALSEYSAKKQNGEEVSYFYFYSKYNTAGKILERKTDSTFNFVYLALVDELKDNGYDSTEAKKYKTAYEAAKKERRSALMNKAKSAL